MPYSRATGAQHAVTVTIDTTALDDFRAIPADIVDDYVRSVTAYVERREAARQHDRWHGDVTEIHAYLAAHPAF